jgi:LacI family transcriptional regulator
MEPWVKMGAATPEMTRQVVVAMLEAKDRPTAIIASDSVIGLEVFKTARAIGLSIPTDLSLISFHDADWTAVTSPPVTVVRQPVYQLGETAANLLVERLNGLDVAARRVVLQTDVVQRASIAVAPDIERS